MKRALLLTTILAGCAAGTTNLPPLPSSDSIKVGGYFPSGIQAAELALGRPIDIANHYHGAALGGVKDELADAAVHRGTMISQSSSDGNGGCILLANVPSHAYDAIFAANAALLKSIPETVLLRPWYEMPSETTAGQCDLPQGEPAVTGPIFKAAWQYMVTFFRAHGVTNVKYVFAPGFSLYQKKMVPLFDPGASFVDYYAEDAYEKLLTYHAPVLDGCAYAVAQGRPFILSETGAIGVANQVPWLGAIKTACPNAAYVLYWDHLGSAGDYTLSDPRAWAALGAL